MRKNKDRGRQSAQKVWTTVALIEFKRKYKYSHQATKAFRVESNITPQSLAIQGDEADEKAAAADEDGEREKIIVDNKWDGALSTYEERKMKRENELWEKRFATVDA